MTVLILSDADVRQLLDMPSCITAMGEVLADLSRGELYNPLRFVTRPPGDTFFGFMPAYRGGAEPVYSLKEVVIAPANHGRGLDPHQGTVLIHDGVTGILQAVLNASAITEIRTAAVSALATRLLARPESRRVAILGSGVQGRSHVEAMRCAVADADITIWSRTPAHAGRLAEATGCRVAGTIGEALGGADVVCTTTSAREPIISRSMLTPGTHFNAVGSSVAHAREFDGQAIAAVSLFVDRRESTLNESGDYLDAVREAGIDADHIRAELGELLVGTHTGRSTDDEITLFKSLGIAVEDLAAAQLCITRARERGIGTEVDL
jgi:ornithine cyclodeaminase/alanine dehydrogenase-like protein (mu-crystallin family)